MSAQYAANMQVAGETSERTDTHPQRFLGRVDYYNRYRPTYPAAILDILSEQCGLGRNTHAADIGAGTGIFAQLLLDLCGHVTAVEPSPEMRVACTALQSRYPHLRIQDGTAEATGLPAQSIDLLSVAQAFHWFRATACRKEFVRCLRPNGWCVVVYNRRHLAGDAFHEEYERFTERHGIDYLDVMARYPDEQSLRGFFAPSHVDVYHVPHSQVLDLEALLGRTISSTYMPSPVDPRFAAMRTHLEDIFNRHEQNGVVRLEYTCMATVGRLA